MKNSITRKYKEIPRDFKIIYQPRINIIAEILLVFTEFGMSLVIAILLYIFHLIIIFRDIKTKREDSFPKTDGKMVVFYTRALTILFVSFLLFAWLINIIIGQHANNTLIRILIVFWHLLFLGCIAFYEVLIAISYLIFYIIFKIKRYKK